MKTHNRKWIGLSTLAAAIALAATGVRAETPAGLPTYRAESCCNLCPAVHDASRYNTTFLGNFTTLVKGNESDWLFRTQEDLRTEFGTTAEGYRMLKELVVAFKHRGVELVVVYQPTRGLINRNKLGTEQRTSFDYERALNNYRQTLKRFEAIGIWTPDLTPLADEQEEHPYYFRGDNHWTAYGAQRTARVVAETVKRIPGFKDIPRQEFVTKKQGRFAKRGTLHRAAGLLCGTSYAYEYTDQFFTDPKEESSGDDLFAEAGTPRITLVGTSQSAQGYNFGGFLKEYIGADILNVAMIGGALDGSMLEYLGSDEFQQTPPKILIWEFSPQQDLSVPRFYRQVMAMLGNACENEPTLLANKTTLKPGSGSKEVLINGADKLISASNNRHQLDIRFSDPSVKTLEATIWYLSGRREQIKLEKPNTVATDGRFAFHMRDDAEWADLNFLALEVQSPKELTEPIEVEARLCKRNSDRPRSDLTAHAEN